LTDKIKESSDFLKNAEVDSPLLDARLLVAAALGCDRTRLLADGGRILQGDELERIDNLIARRAKREPVARILGRREFWKLSFGLNEATLEPRPDSEILIETALKLSRSMPMRLLDLGTGSGCLLLSLLHEYPGSLGLGVDREIRAIEQATINALQLNMKRRATFIVSDWFDKPDIAKRGPYDLIVCNPPYIRADEIPSLMPEVRCFDPMHALDGGNDGLNPYRTLLPQLPKYLAPNGLAVFEIGFGQAAEVSRLFAEAGLKDVSVHKDLAGIERCVAAFAP
jgi:release factor glutamine methyltransferase